MVRGNEAESNLRRTTIPGTVKPRQSSGTAAGFPNLMMMHSTLHPSQAGQPRQLAASFPGPAKTRLLTAIFLVLILSPSAWTQDPQASALTSSLGADLRNAAAVTHSQADLVRKMANDWGHRATSESYSPEFFQRDFANMQFQFQTLRDLFTLLGSLALQLDHPPASNAAAELDAGLNMIAELFTFLGKRFKAGTLEHQTIVRTCRAFEDALWEWERELRKSSARLELLP